jgi:hypothetical protein
MLYSISDNEHKDVIEKLIILNEECIEVSAECLKISQTVSKILRFGIDSQYVDNRVQLATELGQLQEMIDQVVTATGLDIKVVEAARIEKRLKVEKFTRHGRNHST